jgi:hypothetical protein
MVQRRKNKLRLEPQIRYGKATRCSAPETSEHSPAPTKLYPVLQYGLRLSLQCASRCPSAGPCRCHLRQCLHQASHATSRDSLYRHPSPNRRGRSRRSRRWGLSLAAPHSRHKTDEHSHGLRCGLPIIQAWQHGPEERSPRKAVRCQTR